MIAGEVGSVRLNGPPRGVRPTTDRVREVLFNSLGERVVGVPFVDLFAGSGAVGIEALSRGAARALFIERRRDCVQVIRENLGKVGFESRAEVVQGDVYKKLEQVVRWLAGEEAVIFMDPPYADRRWPEIVEWFLQAGDVAARTVIIVEHSRRTETTADLPAPQWSRAVGETMLTRWEKA